MPHMKSYRCVTWKRWNTFSMEERADERISVWCHFWFGLINFQLTKTVRCSHWHTIVKEHSKYEYACMGIRATFNNETSLDELFASHSVVIVSLSVYQLSAALLWWWGRSAGRSFYSAWFWERNKDWWIWLYNLGHGLATERRKCLLSVAAHLHLSFHSSISSVCCAASLALTVHHFASYRHSDIPRTEVQIANSDVWMKWQLHLSYCHMGC